MQDESPTDEIWLRLREEAHQRAVGEPILASYLHAAILNHRCLEDALPFHLAGKLASPQLSAQFIGEVIGEAFDKCPLLSKIIPAL